MTGTTTPYRSDMRAGRDGFAQLLQAEWTKFRTVRGWVIGMVAAALVMVLLSVLSAAGDRPNCAGRGGCPSIAVGPGGEAVADSYYVVHQPLDGNGTITVRVTSLTGLLPPAGGAFGQPVPPADPLSAGRPGVEPWAKAGLIVAESTKQGSPYAAVMVTGSHGVRMQYNYTHDTAGSPGAVSTRSPRWLRLTRAGDTLTGYDSTDGARWIKIGTALLTGLSTTVQSGLFVTSPQDAQMNQHPFVTEGAVGPTLATGVFDDLSLQGARPPGAWSGDDIGGPEGGYPALAGGFHQTGGSFTVSGSGDIAPQVGGVESVGLTIDYSLAGTFAGLIVVIVLGTLFITAEYRRGLIRATLAASPRRGRVLAAKAIVIGAVTFVTGLAAAAVAVVLGEHVLRANHNYIYPVSTLTELRVIVGSAALLALATIVALALGTVLRRGAATVTTAIVAIVLPYYILVPALPAGAAQWLLRVTPAAAFAIQQTLPQYPQVSNLYTPANGYFPLAPWAGLAVLCAYTALALGLAAFFLRRRDA